MTLSRLRETTAWMQEVERRRMPKPRVPEGRERAMQATRFWLGFPIALRRGHPAQLYHPT